MAAGNGFTPTQSRIFDVVKDGLPHRKQELVAAIDAQADDNALRVHLTNMRKLLRPQGRDILGTLNNGQYWYVYVGLMHSAVDGKR